MKSSEAGSQNQRIHNVSEKGGEDTGQMIRQVRSEVSVNTGGGTINMGNKNTKGNDRSKGNR